MASAYEQLLAATIAHVEDLKAHGAKYLPLDSKTLTDLVRPPARVSGNFIRTQPGSSRPATPVVPSEPPPARTATPELISPPDATVAVVGDLCVDSAIELTPGQKEAEMARIQERALACVKCPQLARSRRNVVFGTGTIHTELMFVGEAPGMDEDEQAEPFVGKAGQLLTKIIQAMGLGRDRVYIANVLKCRPDTPGQRTGNRKPTLEEMNTCKPYLLAQISVIRPRVIVALGATALEGLLGRAFSIMKLRGHWQEFNGVPLMPTFHPAYLLRNQAPAVKRQVWEDMLAVMERLGMPVSEKQKGFFLAK